MKVRWTNTVVAFGMALGTGACAVGTDEISECRYAAPPTRASSPRLVSSAETVTASAGSPRP